jgi:hypothetical protein
MCEGDTTCASNEADVVPRGLGLGDQWTAATVTAPKARSDDHRVDCVDAVCQSSWERLHRTHYGGYEHQSCDPYGQPHA